MYKPKKDIRCSLEYGPGIFGGEWKSRIICVLSEKKTLSNGTLRKEMINISNAVAMLKELMQDEIVTRTQYEEIPSGVDIH
ncbi:MAG: winged helix-turn-helix transcriptional regulator [Oxalobacter formigenes]|nr:winged helix-turn-helix transcriptional regulator [Oxalobacter formigenes]